MSTFTEIITKTYHVVSCYTCGVTFGIEDQLYKRVVTDAKGSVFCPACGKETCWRESEDQKRIKELQRRLEWEVKESARLKSLRDSAEASLASANVTVTKLRKRVGAGVCPCCNRSFKQLRAHMKNKHPEFREEKP